MGKNSHSSVILPLLSVISFPMPLVTDFECVRGSFISNLLKREESANRSLMIANISFESTKGPPIMNYQVIASKTIVPFIYRLKPYPLTLRQYERFGARCQFAH